ncbi:MAG: hypothetical protein NVSMB3_13490 [Acidobacteriaceae bacterium]
MQMRPGTVQEGDVLVDGRRMHYLRAGSGPPLLLLHGLVGSHHNWRLNIDSLAASATVYALDLLNMGESDRVPGLDAGLEATADRVIAFMDALGLTEADIAGHSHGGAVTLSLAARHPNRVNRLILFAPANPFCDLGRQLIRFYESQAGHLFARLIPALPRWTKAVALGRMYGDPSRVAADTLQGYTDGLEVRGTIDHVLQIIRRWSADMATLRSVLPAVAAKPALLIWGDQDRAVGLDSARHLQRILLHSSLVILPGVGHIAFEEMPTACNRAVLEFLAAPVAGVAPREHARAASPAEAIPGQQGSGRILNASAA